MKQTFISPFALLVAVAFALVALFGVGASLTLAAHNADGLVGYWNLDDSTADPTLDTSGHGNDGAVNGATYTGVGAPVPGSVDALDFDGVNDVVEVADNADLDLTSAVSVSGWINIDSLTMQATVAGKWGDLGENQRGYLLAVHTNGTPRFYVSTDGINFPSAVGGALTLDTWHHLVGTYDGASLKLYVDGVLVATTPVVGSIFSNNEPLLIGANDGFGGLNRKYTDGSVDEVRIYDRALTSDEVVALNDYGNFTIDSDTPTPAYNPVGTDHTVDVTIDPALAGIPVLFDIDGPNEAESGTVITDGDGAASFTYTSNGESGEDTITACIDTNGDSNCADETNSVEVSKVWFLKHYVTGGASIKDGKKPAWTFAGMVGRTDEGVIAGNFQMVNHIYKQSCHLNEFSALDFTGDETESPVSDLDIATFTGSGWCNNGEAISGVTVVIHDEAEPGAGFDTISVAGGGLNAVSSVISTGNFQVHPPEVE